LLAVLFFTNLNNYKNFIAKNFNEATSYHLQLNGDVELTWWPSITGLLNKIAIHDNSNNLEPRFQAENFAVSTDTKKLFMNYGRPTAIQISATDGVLSGINVVSMLGALERMIECKCLRQITTTGETRFDTLTAEITIENEVYINQDLFIQGSGFTLTGKGILADTKGSKIDYDLVLHIEATLYPEASNLYNLGGYKIPIHCSGDVSKPTCTPVFEHIIHQLLKEDSQKKIKKLEKQIKKEAKQFLKGLLKF
jgi:hypothetical protein